nr:histone-lysine N-methyltransferase SETMAR-like [Onthophagus taurus]
MSRRRIIGPVFFHDTVNAERYQALLQEFIEQLHPDELQQGFFQHDNATAHTARTTERFLQEFYDDRVIGRGCWPPRSPDLTPLDFFLFGHLKNSIYKNRLHTLEELEDAIRQNVQQITGKQLVHVFDNMKRRITLCLENNGQHFEFFL